MGPVPKRVVTESRPRWELSDIFRLHGPAYRRAHRLPFDQLKAMRAIEVCRTAALGGHLDRCDSCGFEHPAYNSCRNRHCPKCPSLAQAQWLERQQGELLPVGYFHMVFTLPHALNPIALTNMRPMVHMLFRAVSETLADFARTHLHGQLGFLAVLHTWDQTLGDHFHLHCLIPGGALSFDRNRWIRVRPRFLFHVRALSIVFRAKFLDRLDQAFQRGQLQFPGATKPLANPIAFQRLRASLKKKKWVVYAKRPFASPETVLDYLGRYTHRVAISNRRILSLDDQQVCFLYRDRKVGDQRKTMTLAADEFIRRFLLHVLPRGLMRIRHYGFMANRYKAQNLARCRQLLASAASQTPQSEPRTWARPKPRPCPSCRAGTMQPIRTLPPQPWDSS